LRQLGIDARVHYPVPIHLQPAYSHLGYEVGAFPRAEEFALNCLSLPMSPLITPAQQDEVVRALDLSLKDSPPIEESELASTADSRLATGNLTRSPPRCRIPEHEHVLTVCFEPHLHTDR
jgi:hypothetical protein